MKTWKWFGHPGHFICSKNCHFHLCTQVGKYLISTIGELWFDRPVREIHAQVYDKEWHAKNNHVLGDEYDAAYFKRFGYEEIGYKRKYETMVFEAGKPCDTKECGCGLPEINGRELDFKGYNNAGEAAVGHMKLCKKWEKK